MFKSPESELLEPTAYTYPKGYFMAQVEFAKKAREIGLVSNLPEAILEYTAVYRRLVGNNPVVGQELDPLWLGLGPELASTDNNPAPVTDIIWRTFTLNPENVYQEKLIPDDGRHFGSYIYKPARDIPTGAQKIELHFNNHRRGQPKSDFSSEYVSERVGDLTRLFLAVRRKMKQEPGFSPEWVTLRSWMNNFPAIRNSLPADFVGSGKILFPPELSFRGDSLWGQFLTNSGGVNQSRFLVFKQNLETAKSLPKLVESFPVSVCLFRGPIDSFFEKYKIR